MCFLSYVNTNKGVCITHNRDEDVERAKNTQFIIRKIKEAEVTMPIDGKSGGTWIATGGDYTLAIINGGKENHNKKTTYPKSRGTIIPLFFRYENFIKFVSKLTKLEYEPFTLVYYDSKNHDLRIITKSENEQQTQILDPNGVHTWSSATLYEESIRKARDKHFKSMLGKDTTKNDIFGMHLRSIGSAETCFNLEVSTKIKTVAITQISYADTEKEFRDIDFINGSSKLIGFRE